ncbi:unnamed protein product [Blepharisma stoltei]|uniref:CCHC-type domain-containing protein n=1 Tax=Blepharisma stoltei TaxID=1481888 RepID=A0AAU9JJC5_9CILI|nr:unnamed protein product [Blepharisma stoltei]
MLTQSHTESPIKIRSNRPNYSTDEDAGLLSDFKGNLFNTFDSSRKATSASTRKQKNAISPFIHKNLSLLRKKRSTSACPKITPELASKVVKDYLLPMFEKDLKNKQNHDRKQQYHLKLDRLQTKPLEKLSGTVYGDFKLTEQLSYELKQMKINLSTVESKLKDAEQEKIKIESEYTKAKEDFLNSEINNQSILFQHSRVIKETSNLDQTFMHLSNQVNKYKAMYEESERKLGLVEKELHDEKAWNDKLRNVAIQLEHGNALIVMESGIIGERLKGLYEAIINIFNINFKESKLENEFLMLISQLKGLAEFEYTNNTSLQIMVKENNELVANIGDLIYSKNISDTQKEKIAKTFKERSERYQKEINSLKEERDKAKADQIEIDKKFNDLNEELKRVRKKMKQYKKESNNAQYEEKFCINCMKPFIEIYNYNWSCRIHKSKPIDDTYWCCGKIGKDAPGCIASKHISKEDEDCESEEESNQKIAFCASCKTPGHFSYECPKDPNTRSNFEPEDELLRINNAENQQKINKVVDLNLKNRVIDMLKERMEGSEFVNGEITIEENEEKIKLHPFRDLLELKEEYVEGNMYNKVRIGSMNDGIFNREMRRARINSSIEQESPIRLMKGVSEEWDMFN